MKTIILALAAAPALAFVPTAPLSSATQAGLEVAPRAPRQVRLARGMSCPTCMSAEQGQFSLGGAAKAVAGILAVGATFLPTGALASSGDSPKISIFGAEPASSPYAFNEATPLYSPYSPYGDGKNSLYKNMNPEEVARAKSKFAETEKRVSRIPSYIDGKLWTEVEGELNRQMAVTRTSMNTLAADKPAAKAAAKAFYQDIEELNVAAQRKDVGTAKAAYSRASADLTAFKAAI